MEIIFIIMWLITFSAIAPKGESALGAAVGSFFLVSMAGGVLLLLVEYFATAEGFAVLMCLVLGVSAIIYGVRKYIRNEEKKDAEIAKRERQLASTIKFVVRGDYVKGFRQEEEFGWVRTSGEKNRENVEHTLKVKAAKRSANALVKFHWQSENQRYEAGRGPKGNPYYQNTTVYGGDAVAILVKEDKINSPINASAKPKQKPDYKKYSGKYIVLDGSNIVGRSGHTFGPLKQLLAELRLSKYHYHIFFDNTIFRPLKEQDLILKGQSIDDCLVKVLDERSENVTVTPRGEAADPHILEYASSTDAAVVSNDRYNDFEEVYPWLTLEGEDARRFSFTVVGEKVLVPRLQMALS